ncbi:flagellar protein FlaG [Paenibacillus phyllosphaerae]|uniref:Flagellar protein FlaG n=1 Tax=Paenibacillus phyllosphaerae TaxID=274593 RepID=A0A7W5B5Y4_9BACL|nr:flagellar protein FlaG [Paenibacillus phyllosphaerae]MBB3114246.1 flagellar protein FlaG [Paenibacillus phyllosphaerae]
MSMNISSSSGSGFSERIAPVEPVKPSSNSSSTVPDTTAQAQAASQIQSISALKQAEMRGEKVTLSDEQVVKAVERAIKAMQGKSTSLEFSVHEKTKLIAVKVLDKDTGEVIREVPPEKTLDFVAKLWEMAGLLVDEKR